MTTPAPAPAPRDDTAREAPEILHWPINDCPDRHHACSDPDFARYHAAPAPPGGDDGAAPEPSRGRWVQVTERGTRQWVNDGDGGVPVVADSLWREAVHARDAALSEAARARAEVEALRDEVQRVYNHSARLAAALGRVEALCDERLANHPGDGLAANVKAALAAAGTDETGGDDQ